MRRALWHTIDPRKGAKQQLWNGGLSVDLGKLKTGSCFYNRIDSLRGRTVLIATQSQLAAAVALVELDGVAGRLILCPPDLSADHMSAIMRRADVTAIVSDRESNDIAQTGADIYTLRTSRIVPAVQPARDTATDWVLLTSGTAGAPKTVVHTLTTLMGAIDSEHAAKSHPTWATFYDVRRYGGLQILLRSLAGGGSMVMSGTGQPPADVLAEAIARGATRISGTPSHWRRVLMSPAARQNAPDYIRLSGEIADQAVLDSLSAFFPHARIAHAFASTEAGVAFEVQDGMSGFPAALLNRDDGCVRMNLKDGSLRIRSPRTALRYLGDEGALRDEDGFVDTEDMIERRGDRCYFVGRRSGVINVGGLKVHPEEVEAVINRHPRIELSRVAARRNPITGAIVVADVVVSTSQSGIASPREIEELKMDIVAFCRQDLPPHKVPSAIRIVPSIEVAASGKLVRTVA